MYPFGKDYVTIQKVVIEVVFNGRVLVEFGHLCFSYEVRWVSERGMRNGRD